MHVLPQSETGWSTSLPLLTKNSQVVRHLARALVAGGLGVDEVTAKANETLGREWRWMRPLAGRYCAAFAGVTRPRLADVVAFLLADRRFGDACRVNRGELRKQLRNDVRVVQFIAGPQAMQPVEAAAGWGVPAMASVAELAQWLRVPLNELEWFADRKGLVRGARMPEALRHYSYRWMAKRTGGARLIESPKERMKGLQREILAGILDRVPAHEAVHGFVRGRSIRTFAEWHVGREMVLRMDLKDFFSRVRRARVQAVFRTLGYPESVADLLGGMATTSTPRDVFGGVAAADVAEMRALYGQSHLPQGAPSSPALANACCYRLDCRLAGLARAAGASYTRYADDLAFSGDGEFARGVRRFADHVGAVVLEEGMAVNFHKTRVMRQGVRQHLAGLVVNERVNVRRVEYDRLKATLTNCARYGVASQNLDGRGEFRAHLEGRVEFVRSVHAERGARLRELLEGIVWE